MSSYHEKVHDSLIKMKILELVKYLKDESERFKRSLEFKQWEMYKIMENFIINTQVVYEDMNVEKTYYKNYLDEQLENSWIFENFEEIENIAINLIREKKIILAEKDFNIESYTNNKLNITFDFDDSLFD